MKVLGKEITKHQFGVVSLLGYIIGYAIYFSTGASLIHAVSLLIGMAAGLVWTYLAFNEEKTLGLWVFVVWQVFVFYNFYLGIMGL